MKTYLFTPYYRDDRPARRKELDACLKRNLENKEIDQVVILTEGKCHVQHPKLSIICLDHRPTYRDFFDLRTKGLNILANADIFFLPKDIEKLKEINYTGKIVTLTRWEVPEIGIPYIYSEPDGTPKDNSQDVWIWKEPPFVEFCDFALGFPGCDSRIAAEFTRSGFMVINPSLEIRAFHLHNSKIRNYTHEARIPPPYLSIKVENKNQINFQSPSVAQVEAPKMTKQEAREERMQNVELSLQSGYKNKLSILIPTIKKREPQFMSLLGELIRQINRNNYGQLVQVLHIQDKGKEEETYYPIGKKRNDLLKLSTGENVVYIDDDDNIHPKYVELIIGALKDKPDCVTFNGELTFKEGKTFPYNFNLKFKEYRQDPKTLEYQRPPGHLTPIRREIAIKHKFKEFSKERDKGSDVHWSLDIVRSGDIKTSKHINEKMYHYLCDTSKTD